MKNCGFCVAMVLVQFAYGGSNIPIKITLEKGLNQFVFVVYRHIIATLLLGPMAYVLERKERPSLSVSAFGKIFLLSSLGTTIYPNVYYAGLDYTSPTVATALSNVIPSLTFLMAVFLRLEKVKIRSASGQAKVLGTIICIGGSLVFTFWSGGYQFKGFVDGTLINIYSTKLGSVGKLRHREENWLKGSCLIRISTIAWSGWLVLQGVVVSALSNCIQTWCINCKGPVFSSTFAPLCIVIVAIFSAIAFAERLHLGSLVGACLIIVGSLHCALGQEDRQFCDGKWGYKYLQ
ncbi:hypothetical protein CRYUN_Cryun19dG0101600 [Craigia yunnanensis]